MDVLAHRVSGDTQFPGDPGSCPPVPAPSPGRSRTASSWSTPWLEYLKYSFLPGRNKPGFPATPLATDRGNLQPWLETGLFPATRYLNSGHHGTCGCGGIAQDFWWPAPSNRGDKWPWTGLASVHDNSSYRALRRLNYGQRQGTGKEWRTCST